MLHPSLLNELDDPARVEIDAEADTATVLGEMLDREPQPPRPRRPEHQPVGAAREVFIGERVAELLVIGAEVAHVDARLRHAGGATGLEDIGGLAGKALGDPARHRATPEPFVLERGELLQVVVILDLGDRIERQRLRILQPEGAAGGGVEMPGHHLHGMGIEGRAGLLHGGFVGNLEHRLWGGNVSRHRGVSGGEGVSIRSRHRRHGHGRKRKSDG